MKKLILTLLTHTFLSITLFLKAQDGVPDLTFNGGKAEILLPHTSFNRPNDMTLQGDGKILTTGFAVDSFVNGRSIYITRYLASGMLDNSFGTNGILFKTSTTPYISGERILVQPDGKIVIAANFADGSGFPKAVQLMRFLSNGNADSTFGVNGVADTFRISGSASVQDLILLSSGKFLLAESEYPKGILVRFNSNGSLDNTFNSTGYNSFSPGFNGAVTIRLLENPDNTIMAAGSSSNGGSMYYYLRKFKSTGVADSTFNGTGEISNQSFSSLGAYIAGIARQANGKYILAGHNGYRRDSLVVGRLNADGTPDNSFAVTIAQINHKITRGTSMCLDADDRILLAGFADTAQGFSAGHTAVTRINANGGIDNTFGTNGSFVSADFAYGVPRVLVQPDTKVLICSYKIDIQTDIALQAIYRLNNSAFNGIVEEGSEQWLMYPNPTNDVLYIPGANGTIQVFSISGKLVLQEQNSREQISLGNLIPGAYIVCATIENKKTNRQLVVVK